MAVIQVKRHSMRSAAKYCSVTAGTVRNWILTGRLPAERMGARLFIDEADLDRLKDERAMTGTTRVKPQS